MAFVYPDNDYCCKVTFHMRKDFRDDISKERELRTHYVDKGDQESLIYYINEYMNTNVKDKRPGKHTCIYYNASNFILSHSTILT